MFGRLEHDTSPCKRPVETYREFTEQLLLYSMCGRREAEKHLKHLDQKRWTSRCRMGGRVVEGTSLENWRTFARTVGSNPTPSATSFAETLFRRMV